MTSPGSVIGFVSNVRIGRDSVSKCYKDINDYHWYRILEASVAFAACGIGPRIVSMFDSDIRCITYEKATPLVISVGDDIDKLVIPPGMSKRETVSAINHMIDKMHALGWGHGDLNIRNIGYVGKRFVVFDLDTVYRISEGPTEWLREWMDVGFEWDSSFEAFIANDYEAWFDSSLQSK